MTEYTIIEPTFEFIPPPDTGEELEFLELATRTCYKSEDHIKPGSAEKLLSRVVNEYKHLSVTEHANCVMEIYAAGNQSSFSSTLHYQNQLLRITERGSGSLLVSGNIRMWKDAIENASQSDMWNDIRLRLHEKWPFFFDKPECDFCGWVTLLDESPLTNESSLTPDEIKAHMTLTYRLIGDRSMSHQLVRHRLFAFSQESQRYCNYGKKGFQFVVPPSVKEKDYEKQFIAEAVAAYEAYNRMIAYSVKPEDARGLLPNCCKTEVVTTGTIGYWVDHIFPHRALNPKAQWQIRGITLGIMEHMKTVLPEVF